MYLKKQKYSDDELLSIRRKDYLTMVFPSILKSLSLPREGTGKEVTKEEVLDWFNWMYQQSEIIAIKETKGNLNGLYYEGVWYPVDNETARKLLDFVQPFSSSSEERTVSSQASSQGEQQLHIAGGKENK